MAEIAYNQSDYVRQERWLLASEVSAELREQVQREFCQFLGGVAVRGEAGVLSQETNHHASLMTAVQQAALGDERARSVVKNNAATDVVERLFKVAHVTKVHMKFVGGWLEQAGRRLTDIHKNTLEQMVLNEEMVGRSRTELKNTFWFQTLKACGLLETHNALVCSPASTTMSEREKRMFNFDTKTEACSMQYLSADGDDVLLETALVAGKKTPQSSRHDMATIREVARLRGVKLDATDATEMIGHIMLVPKTATPFGLIDIVKMQDDVAGGTFYGQEAPRQNYHLHALECERINNDFQDIVEAITDELIREAHTFTNPIDAVRRLDYWSERYCVRRAVNDATIDEAVFGPRAALHIQEARFFMQQGEMERAESSLHMAQETAVSGSCPIFRGLLEPKGGDESSGSTGESSQKKMMTCPFCSAKVYDDPCARVLSCWDCKALVVNGKVKSTGNGGSQKRAAEKAAKQAERQQKQPPSLEEQVDDVFAGRTFEEEKKRHEQEHPTSAVSAKQLATVAQLAVAHQKA